MTGTQHYDTLHKKFSKYVRIAVSNRRHDYCTKKQIIELTEGYLNPNKDNYFGTSFENLDLSYKESDNISSEVDFESLVSDKKMLSVYLSLPKTRQTILYWHIVLQYPFTQIATLLDIPTGQVSNTYYNTIKKIRGMAEKQK